MVDGVPMRATSSAYNKQLIVEVMEVMEVAGWSNGCWRRREGRLLMYIE
jgi:hypothetical protein